MPRVTELIAKISHQEGRVFKGYLTGAEASVFLQAGCKFSKDDVFWISENTKSNNKKWFYFSLSNALHRAINS